MSLKRLKRVFQKAKIWIFSCFSENNKCFETWILKRECFFCALQKPPFSTFTRSSLNFSFRGSFWDKQKSIKCFFSLFSVGRKKRKPMFFLQRIAIQIFIFSFFNHMVWWFHGKKTQVFLQPEVTCACFMKCWSKRKSWASSFFEKLEETCWWLTFLIYWQFVSINFTKKIGKILF